MGRLLYSMMTSVDGFVADRDGDFSWASLTRKCSQ